MKGKKGSKVMSKFLAWVTGINQSVAVERWPNSLTSRVLCHLPLTLGRICDVFSQPDVTEMTLYQTGRNWQLPDLVSWI